MLIFTGSSPAATAASMPAKHARDREVDVVHALEHRVIQ